MLKKLKQHAQVQSLTENLKLAGTRLTDQHISLAVTGLSGSGKTAFITSLVNVLLEANGSAELPFFSPVAQGRLVGVRRDTQPDLSLVRFNYDGAMRQLLGEPADWPVPTNGISQIRLRIKYRQRGSLKRLMSEHSHLVLDITDYPGEWLLDLPLLELSYAQWCEQFWQQMQQPERHQLATPFLQALSEFDPLAPGDEVQLQNVSALFTDYLHSARAAGFQLIQPGRFILPGELAGAPVLQFFPVPCAALSQSNSESAKPDSGKETQHQLLLERFEHYKSTVVKPFYKHYFKGFDRQVILVDCLSALNAGKHSFDDLQLAINWLMSSFHYGSSNILKRLFSPKIDKLAFAASKADHVTPGQHGNLVRLLESMVHKARQEIQFEGVVTESTAVASISASKAGTVQHEGETLEVLKGRDSEGNKVVLYPGDVPQRCPESDFWHQQGFDFPRLAPPVMSELSAVPHIRMDQLLDFLLADKLG